jgi:hypothetical protein
LQHAELEEALQCETCYLLGLACLGKQQTDQAEALLRQVTLLDPDYRAVKRLLTSLRTTTSATDVV